MSRCCVANLTHMLQTSSFNHTHVLVASNNISLCCQEGRIYIIYPVLIILLNPLPVLVALKILQDIHSFTRSFVINTRPNGLARMTFKSSSVKNLVYRYKQTKHDSNVAYHFSDPSNIGCCFAISLPPSADSAKINISTNGH